MASRAWLRVRTIYRNNQDNFRITEFLPAVILQALVDFFA
jgi:hypothetical protein